MQIVYVVWLCVLDQSRYVALVLIAANICLASSNPSRDEVVAWLRHQESLVESAKFEMVETYEPTRPEWVPLIKRACEYRGIAGQEGRYILSPDVAARKSYAVRWWRDGKKEYIERYFPPVIEPANLVSVMAFDGGIIRGVQQSGEDIKGIVTSPERQNWYNSDRVTPFNLLYEYMGKALSEVVELGSSFDARSRDLNGAEVIEVSVEDPRGNGISYKLIFDEDRRLIRRDIHSVGYSRDRRKRLMFNRMDYKKYADYKHFSGESIWFPGLVVNHYYLGEVPGTGEMAEYWRSTIDIRQVEMNPSIPKGKFALSFTSDMSIWDDIHGQGWVGSEYAESIASSSAGQGRWWIALLICLLLVCIVLTGAWWRRVR